MSLDEEQSRRTAFLTEIHKASASETARIFFASCLNCPGSPPGPEGDVEGGEAEAESVRLYDTLIEGANLDLPAVWFALGHAYLHGWGTQKSHGLAVYWYRKAADSGHTDAMLHIAHVLVSLSGRPTEAEKREARLWYRRAASLGNRGWMNLLGLEFRGDCGVEVDYDEAIDWFRKDHTKVGGDSTGGTSVLAYMDPTKEALDYFERIAATGEPESCFYLGLLFGNPLLPFCDHEKAMDWMIQAVERKSRNSPRAMLELAWHCFLGSGNVQDIQGAYGWLELLFNEKIQMPRMQNESRTLLKQLDDLTDQMLMGEA